MSRSRKIGRWVIGPALLLGLAVASSPRQVFAPQNTIQANAPFEIVKDGLRDPTGLARDPATGDLFVSEARTGFILRIDSTGLVHTHAQGFRKPRGLARDPRDGSLLVVDEQAGTLSRIPRQGVVTQLRRDLDKPHWVAVAADGTIVLTAEEGAGFNLPGDEEGVLLSFAPDGSNPQLLARGLKSPEGLRVLADGRIIVLADRLRSEPERDGGTLFELAPDGTLTVLVRSGFKKPHDLALDTLAATFLTADKQRDDGQTEKGVIGKAFSEDGVGQFATGLKQPQGLLFDAQGNLYVAESDTGRVLKFRTPQPPIPSPPRSPATRVLR